MEVASRKGLALIAVAIAASLLVVGMLLFVAKNPFEPEELPELATTGLDESVRAHEPTKAESLSIYSTRSTDLDSLRKACPNMLEELSSECTSTLEEYFKDATLPEWDNWLGRLLHLGVPLTFARVFEDPSVNRNLALAALAREECRLDGGPIRPELHATCNAKAIASHALFTKFCMPSKTTFQEDWFGTWFTSGTRMGQESEFENYYEYQILRIESERDLDLGRYKRQKESLTRRMFRSAWLETKCSTFDSELTRPLNIWPSIQQSVISDYSERYGSSQEEWGEDERMKFHQELLSEEYLRLVSVAARLGDDWAITNYYRRGTKDPVFVSSIDKLRPWLPSLRRSTLVDVPRVQLLMNAISAIELAEGEGFEIDRKLLMHAVCRSNPTYVDCATAFEELVNLDLSTRAREIARELRLISYEQELVLR